MGKVKYDSNPDNNYSDGYNAGRRYKAKTKWRPILILVGLALAAIFLFLINIPKAEAWTYGLSGSGECQADGTFKITWVVDNTTEEQALRIKDSNREVVPIGTEVPANSPADFSETVPGIASDTTLTLKGNWQGDREKRTRTATVTNEGCKQPEPPVVVIPPTVVGLPNTGVAE